MKTLKFASEIYWPLDMVQKDSLGNESWANETNFSEDDGKLGKTIETDIMDKTNSSIQVIFAQK